MLKLNIYIYIYIYIFEQVKSTELCLFYHWFHMVFDDHNHQECKRN